MIKVCDAVMGSGKTMAAINYMKSHKDRRFIYISPYLSELKRVKEECRGMYFIEPSGRRPKTNFSKISHLEELISLGKNIVCTHQAFRGLADQSKEKIKKYKYILIMDECIDMLMSYNSTSADIRLLERAGIIELSGNRYILKSDYNEWYKGGCLDEIVSLCRRCNLICLKSSKKNDADVPSENENEIAEETKQAKKTRPVSLKDRKRKRKVVSEQPLNKDTRCYYCWQIPIDILYAFDEVIILTYLFEVSSLCNMFKIEKTVYEYIGVSYNKDNGYAFSSVETMYKPDYLGELSRLININTRVRLNDLGDDIYSYSQSWFTKNKTNVDEAKKRLNTYFIYDNKQKSADKKLWSSFKSAEKNLKGKGYASGFLAFNQRSSNEYRDKTVLAYCVNLYVPSTERQFYKANGIKVEGKLDDGYALSVMLQWIWRSAIRDGKPIDIYIPSKRMRQLLIDWIYEMECDYAAWLKGKEAKPKNF